MLLNPGYEILEVKFDRTIPPWFQKIIQSFEWLGISFDEDVVYQSKNSLRYKEVIDFLLKEES